MQMLSIVKKIFPLSSRIISTLPTNFYMNRDAQISLKLVANSHSLVVEIVKVLLIK